MHKWMRHSQSTRPTISQNSFKKIANHKSTASEPQLPFAQLVEKIHREDITRTHIDRHKLNTNFTLSSSINNLSIEIDHLTVKDIHRREEYIAHGINVVRHNYLNDPKLNGKPLFLKFLRSGDIISTCPDKTYTKLLETPNFQKQTFNQAMKCNQNHPNKQVTSNNMTGKPLPFSRQFYYCASRKPNWSILH